MQSSKSKVIYCSEIFLCNFPLLWTLKDQFLMVVIRYLLHSHNDPVAFWAHKNSFTKYTVFLISGHNLYSYNGSFNMKEIYNFHSWCIVVLLYCIVTISYVHEKCIFSELWNFGMFCRIVLDLESLHDQYFGRLLGSVAVGLLLMLCMTFVLCFMRIIDLIKSYTELMKWVGSSVHVVYCIALSTFHDC
jgi:hypothetical protein